MAKKQNTIFLLGEAELVSEFGMFCSRGDATILYKLNNNTKGYRLPAPLRQTASVPASTRVGFELTNTDKAIKQKNLRLLERSLSKETIILSSSVTVTITEQATWMKHPSRLLGISALPTLLSQGLIELTPSVHTGREVVQRAQQELKRIGKESAIVQDRIGMVMPRILCQLVNEAFFAVIEDVAAPKDIDIAMKLGTNYPDGPLSWGVRIGYKQVLSILEALHADLGEERYRIAPLLRQMAMSGG